MVNRQGIIIEFKDIDEILKPQNWIWTNRIAKANRRGFMQDLQQSSNRNW